MIGTLAEAREIFEAVGDRWEPIPGPPAGWVKLGEGRDRAVYLSPSGVAYKICHLYELSPNKNEVEAKNFDFIKARGRLQGHWAIPEYTLYRFTAVFTQWSESARAPVKAEWPVVVTAVEHIEGKNHPDSFETSYAFRRAGLYDACSGNALTAKNGKHYILDAAELMNELEYT